MINETEYTNNPLTKEQEMELNLIGHYILDIYGVNKLYFDTNLIPSLLSKKMIEAWIPYLECHQCGRYDYCKFVISHPGNHDRALDIKCGVVSACIGNFVKYTSKILDDLKDENVQDYLNGAFYYVRFIRESELLIGDHMSADNLLNMNARTFSNVYNLRINLDLAAMYWSKIGEFGIKQPILLVEGQSEKAFLDELKHLKCSCFLHLMVDTYKGEGNAQPTRIGMLLDKYKSLGYKVYIQGDCDGNNNKNDKFGKLLTKNLIEKNENTFIFKYDFETSVPPKLLFIILVELGLMQENDEEIFSEKTIYPYKQSIIKTLANEFNIKIDKIKFAQTLAKLIIYLDMENNIFFDEHFMDKTELGLFLRFIQRIA